MPKEVVAEGVAALEAVVLAPERREPAQQGLVAAKEERARQPQAGVMLLVVERQRERSVEARQQARWAVEHWAPALQAVLRLPHRVRRLLKQRRLLHLRATLQPRAAS